jgi:hypothetical protein
MPIEQDHFRLGPTSDILVGISRLQRALRPMGHWLTLRYGWNRISADDSFWNGTDLEWQSHPNLLQRSEGASYW